MRNINGCNNSYIAYCNTINNFSSSDHKNLYGSGSIIRVLLIHCLNKNTVIFSW